MRTSTQDVVPRFIDRFGLALEREGLPLIAGRMLALFLIEGGPFAFDSLAASLRVSRGSVSTNTRVLESMGVLERTSVPGDRRNHYQLSDDPYAGILEATLGRLRKRQAIVTDTLSGLCNLPDARTRLEHMAQFQTLAIRSTEETVERWHSDPPD